MTFAGARVCDGRGHEHSAHQMHRTYCASHGHGPMCCARARSPASVFTPARDSRGLEPTLNDAAAVHTGDTWVGRAVSARTGSQSAPRKATTGWRAQPMRHVLGRDNGQWDVRKTWARGFPHMLTLVKWQEKRARRDTEPRYERSAVRAEAGLGLLLLLLLLRGVCWDKDRASLLHSGACCLCFTLSEVSISDVFILSCCGFFLSSSFLKLADSSLPVGISCPAISCVRSCLHLLQQPVY